MTTKSIVLLGLGVSASIVISCSDEPSSPMIADADATSVVDASSDVSSAGESLCRDATDMDFLPSEPYVPEWFASPSGYRRRLALGPFAVCAVAAAGTVSCWGDESITGVKPILADDLNWPLVVDLVKMPLENIVDISFQRFWGYPFALVIDERGQAWGWSYWKDFFPPLPPERHEKPSLTPSLIDLGGQVFQGVSGGLIDGLSTPTIIARVDPGTIHGVSESWVFLGKPERWDWEEGEPTPETAYPFVVPGVTDFVQVQSGTGFFCGLRKDRQVICWGAMGYPGFPQDNWCEMPRYYGPTEIPLLRDTVHLATGPFASCAVKSDESLWCWGNWEYEYTDPECPDSDISVPKQIPCVSGAISVTAPSEGFVCVLHRGGHVSCIHDSPRSYGGLLEEPSDYYPRQWPGAKVPGLPERVKEIDALRDCACALTETDEVYCWGSGVCQGPATSDGTWSDAAVLVTRLQ